MEAAQPSCPRIQKCLKVVGHFVGTKGHESKISEYTFNTLNIINKMNRRPPGVSGVLSNHSVCRCLCWLCIKSTERQDSVSIADQHWAVALVMVAARRYCAVYFLILLRLQAEQDKDKKKKQLSENTEESQDINTMRPKYIEASTFILKCYMTHLFCKQAWQLFHLSKAVFYFVSWLFREQCQYSAQGVYYTSYFTVQTFQQNL